MKKRIINIFGLKFVDTDFKYFDKQLKKKSNFLVFPAAPALTNIKKDKEYYISLKTADYALFDSGYLCILLRLFKNIKVTKFSGLKFLKFYLNFLYKNKLSLFLVDPNINSSNKNINLLKKYKLKNFSNYVAPKYKRFKVRDKKLLKILNKKKPKNILINLGGGTQEKLGAYLKKQIKFKTNIICTGAAISFLTGEQAAIPNLIDKLYLGWFFRIIFSPKDYFMRYFNAIALIKLLLKNKI